MSIYKIKKLLLLFIILVCSALALTSCHIKGNIIGLSDYYYADSKNYSAGEAELNETIENIDINWSVGNVKVLSHNSNTISFKEESENELTDDTKLRYWLDNKTLRIKFCSCGKWNLSDLKKELTVLVPDTLVMNDLKVNTVSANVNLSDCAVTQLVKVNTISGEVDANLSEPLNEFKGSSVSGSFTVNAPAIERFDTGIVSGVVNLSLQKESEWLDVDTTSGNVNLVLPKSASFKLDYDNTSGDLTSDLLYSKSRGKWIFGDGKGEYKIVTVSGDVRITSNN